MITVEKINEMLERVDKIFRPYALFMHTEDAEMLLAEYPELEKRFVISKTNLVEKGKCYFVNREDYESWTRDLANVQFY